MKQTVIAAALLVLLGTPIAIAQSGRGAAVGTTINGGIPEAPVGHRQPKASDVPSEKNLSSDALSKEDALLDKKIKSICRGC